MRSRAGVSTYITILVIIALTVTVGIISLYVVNSLIATYRNPAIVATAVSTRIWRLDDSYIGKIIVSVSNTEPIRSASVTLIVGDEKIQTTCFTCSLLSTKKAGTDDMVEIVFRAVNTGVTASAGEEVYVVVSISTTSTIKQIIQSVPLEVIG